jgi:hypothetical protein
MTFTAWDSYPNHANFSIFRKNIIYLVFVGLMIAFAYFQFGVGGISQGSNVLRILLFLILILVGGWFINKNSKIVNVEISNSKIKIGDQEIDESSIFGFEIIQLDGYLEYSLLTTKLYGQFRYFYKLIEDPENAVLTRNLLEITQYTEGLASRDYVHKFLRYLRYK